MLDRDFIGIPVCGGHKQSANNGHFESTGYHLLLLFNGKGRCLATMLRPGNGHSAEGREDRKLPESERQQATGKEVAF